METNIKDLKPGMKNINLIFIVLDVGRPITTQDGHEVRTCRVADKTASVNLSVWDEPGTYLQPGDICKILRGYVNLWKGCVTLYISKGGEINKIGEFCLVFTETPNISDPNAEVAQQTFPNKMTVNMEHRVSPTQQMGGASNNLSPTLVQNQGSPRGATNGNEGYQRPLRPLMNNGPRPTHNGTNISRPRLNRRQ